jgi:aminopeptidase N
MSRKWIVLGAIACSAAAAAWLFQITGSRILTVTPPSEGISRTLATERAANISAVRYALTLAIPRSKNEPIQGNLSARLRLHRQAPIIFDFAQPADRVSAVRVNGQVTPVESEHGHLVIAGDRVNAGENIVEITFRAGDAPLNRNDDFLYSLFVPARASQAFPCFDQPDLKASLSLTLEIPSDWVAVANSPEIGRSSAGDRLTLKFGETAALPTYLFGFAAGRFAVERGERNGRPFQLFHRETDQQKVAANRDIVFDLHQQALDWLESYTNRKYPFAKLDFVLLPAFQFRGMEHAGAIYYNAPGVFLDKTATQDQVLARANLIAHETAHMWFGDLVTMKWFDDVWLKEVFANFVASKIVNPSFPDMDHELRFFMQHYPSAYRVDRTAGANPIRQPLENLKDAGSLYGPIIYQKAPIVMRQLEYLLGPDALRDGLREYLTRFAFGNATWSDLVSILDARTEEDLAAWSQIWVDEPGRPTIETNLETEAGQIARLSFTQSDPRSRSLLWNQQLQVALGYEHGARISTVRLNDRSAEVPRVKDLPLPRYVLANGEGVGYGLFKIDAATKRFLIDHLPEIGDGLTRGTAWVTLWDDMLEHGTPPDQLFDLAMRTLPQEREELNVSRMLTDSAELFWRYLPSDERPQHAIRLELTLRAGLAQSPTTSMKAAYFAAFRRTVTTSDGLSFLERVWRGQEQVEGLTFAETDFIEMAQDLALRGGDTARRILAEQHTRIGNPDRKARFAFVMPALSTDAADRDAFVASLARVENRARERWVTDALAYASHPLRRHHAERYIRPGLELLREIQRTGDIFFPLDWTAALLDGHNSPAAAGIVRQFLAEQPEYPPRLRRIIEQVADPLFRSARVPPGGSQD